jgi:O-antigen ligase
MAVSPTTIVPPKSSAGLVSISRKQIVLALLIASTGFDNLSIKVGGDTLRATYIVYLILFFALLRHMRYPKVQTWLIGAFCLLALAGSLIYGLTAQSAMYTAWVVFSYGVIYALFYYFAREHQNDFVAAILLAGRAQMVIALLLFAAHIQDRAYLLYYEPSYFAYGLIPYVAAVVWGIFSGKTKLLALDALLLLVTLVDTGSATLLTETGVIWIVGIVFNGFRIRQVLTAAAVAVGIVIALIVYANTAHDLMAVTIKTIISSPDAVAAMVGRGGDRMPRLQAAWYIFNLNPWLGVGIGQYRSVSSTLDLSSFGGGVSYLSAADTEAINIYVELLATVGIPTACLFFAFLIRTLTLRKLKTLDDRQKILLLGLVAMLIMLNFEANYLRCYLWMLLGAYTGSVAVAGSTTTSLRPRQVPAAEPAPTAPTGVGVVD